MKKLNLAALPKKDKILLAILLLALLVLVISCFLPKAANNYGDGSELVSAKTYKRELETQLSEMLGKVSGVGEVSVMVTLEGETSREIAYNESVSSTKNDGGASVNETKDAVLVRGDAQSAPYTLKDNYPKVIGVLVVADGAQESATKAYIISAVKTTLDVAANNIVVLPMGADGKE